MGLIFDLRDLRAFLEVADEENLGRAADRLGVSASPLSRHMLQLEARLGVTLFERVRKRLRLTKAGRDFREQARSLLSHAAEIERAIGAARSGEVGSVEIGYVPGAMWSGLLPQIIQRVREELPGLSLQLRPMRSTEAAERLRRGSLDLAFVHTVREQDDDAALANVLLQRDAFCLVVPRDYPLDRADAIEPATLGRQDWIALERERSREFRGRFLAACGAYGFVPSIRHEAADIQSVLGLVEAGMGVAVLQSAVSRTAPPGVSFIDLPGFPLDVQVYLLWRSLNQQTAVTRLIEIARSTKIDRCI